MALYDLAGGGRMKKRNVATERYRSLIEQMAEEFLDEHGRKFGDESWIARQLGTVQSTISKIRSGDRDAGGKVVEKAIKTRGSGPRFSTMNSTRSRATVIF